MREVSISNNAYRIVAVERDGQWVAHAERADTGDRFGIECAAQSEQAAVDRLAKWLHWQQEHTTALETLQQAERAFHRTLAGSAFANPAEGPTAIELQQESLRAVEAARTALDDVRARKPA
jgi:hypothetical protein